MNLPYVLPAQEPPQISCRCRSWTVALEVTHPVFGYRLSYRRLFEVQARLLIRYLTGEVKEYPTFVTR